MLRFKDLKITIVKRFLFSVDDLELQPGLIALVGRNGAGKSTFFKTIMGLEAAENGTILIHNQGINSFTKVELAKKIAIVYSKSTVFGNHCGRDVLYLGRLPYQNSFATKTAIDHQIINETIDLLGIAAFVDRTFYTLSDGEKQLIMIGRALAQDTDIILLDEPSAFLDLVNRHTVMHVLRKIVAKTNKLILFSTHDVAVLPEICDAILLIHEGKLVQLTEKSTFIHQIKTSFGIEIN